MPKIFVTMRNGEEREIEAPLNLTLMECIRDAKIDELEALCGGCLACGTCHVYVNPEFADLIPPRSEDEEAMLEASDHLTEKSRLSCQIRMTDALEGIRLTIAPED